MTLLAAKAQPSARTLSFVAAIWVALNIYWPVDWQMDPKLLAAITLIPQTIVILLAVHVLRRAWAERVGMRVDPRAIEPAA